MIAGITELLPVFRQRAQEAEDGRVVPAESVKGGGEVGGGAAGDPPVWFRFLGCNPRHHSLALAPLPAPAASCTS